MVAEPVAVALPSTEDVCEMDKLMSDGKRNYICNQPHLALDCFVEVCEKLSKWYGQESEMCVDAYLFYGKTLLDIARLENGVLGHAIKEMPVFGSGGETDDQDTEKDVNTEDEEDSAPKMKAEEIRSCVERALREDNLYNESTEEEGENTEEEGDEPVPGESAEDKETEDTSSTDAKAVDSSTSTTTATTTSPNGTSDPVDDSSPAAITKKGEHTEGMEVDDGIECAGSDDDNDDVSNLELAWEMLELSSVILRRELQKESSDQNSINTKLAEAKYGLAQISLEAGRYQESVNDFTECLSIYKQVLDDKNGRVIAEGHYNIALALSLDKKYDDAIKGYEMAVSILKARVGDLEARVKLMDEKKDKSDGDFNQLREWNEEIAELNDLIVLDMMTKIEDAQEAKKLSESDGKADEAASGTKAGFDAGFSEGFDEKSSSGGSDVVNDCTGNIRSVKRKSDDEMSDGCEKKVKSYGEAEKTTEKTE